jgi:hypothetical protein
LLTLAIACGTPRQEPGDSDTASSSRGETTSSGEAETSGESTGETASGTTGEAWPACVAESGPDVAIEIALDPAQPDQEWHRYSGPCTVSSIVADASSVTAELDCTGDDGPAAQWSAALTVAGLADAVPSELLQGASVDLVVVVQRFHAQLTAFAITSAGELVMAGASGNHPNVEDGSGNPAQALWAPLVVSPESTQVCPTQPGIECPLVVARNAVGFSGLDTPDVELFDHSSFVGTNYAYGLGRALAFVDDGSGDVCEGSQPSWYDFVVARVASR